MKYVPKIGAEFPVGKETVEAHTAHVVERTRSWIALMVVTASVVAIAITAAVGMTTGEYAALGITWGVVAGPLTWILAHYFPRSRNGRYQIDYEGSA